MLNRAPTLHRLGIQAFEPILVEGKAIKLHPLVCTAFNADFDGDQMAVHLPLSVEAQAECRFMLLSPNNLLKPSDGGPVAVPSQDMVLGIYYLTQERPGAKGEGKFFKDLNEAILAYENGVITLHSKIRVRTSVTNEDGTVEYGYIDSTLGRCLFNEIIPQDLGYVNRDVDKFGLEIDFHGGKKQLKGILQKVINVHGTVMTAEVLDEIKAIGYKYSTKAAMTVSVSEMTVPPIKAELIANAEKRVEQVTRNYQRLLTTDEERHRDVVRIWEQTDNELTRAPYPGSDKQIVVSAGMYSCCFQNSRSRLPTRRPVDAVRNHHRKPNSTEIMGMYVSKFNTNGRGKVLKTFDPERKPSECLHLPAWLLQGVQ